MDEIRAVKPSGLRCVSTFSGGGGSSCGYRMAGIKVVWANEFVQAARDTYAANWPDTILDGRDIRRVTGQSVLDAIGMNVGELDIFDGSPPCASFSTAGSREGGWGKVKKYSDVRQRTDDLFFEYARLLSEIKPRAFIAENVSGLVKGVAKGYFKEILVALKACGYRVSAKVLDAQWLGVPQGRQRLIFIGFRNDLNIDPAHPKPLPYFYSLKDALAFSEKPTQEELREVFLPESIAVGAEIRRIKEGETSSKYFQLVRARLDRPCPTITATSGQIGAASIAHPFEHRKFARSELLAISSFPSDYKVIGQYSKFGERIGRAVPPIMMRSIAEGVRDSLLSATKQECSATT